MIESLAIAMSMIVHAFRANHVVENIEPIIARCCRILTRSN